MSILIKSLRALTAAAHVAAPFAVVSAAQAKNARLPAPVVSRALDALLIPNDAAVAEAFGLPIRNGVLVLAVEPRGVADRQGIEPGDILVDVAGTPIRVPADIDALVAKGLTNRNTAYAFDVSRAGTIVAVATAITYELFVETFSVSEISTWESWSENSSFSYSDYVSEYSEEITQSYESTETYVEEVEEVSTQEPATGEDAPATGAAADDAAGDPAGEGADDPADDAAGDQADDAADDQGDAGADEAADDGADDPGDAGDEGGADDGDGDGDGGGDDAGGGGEDEGGE